MAKTIILRFSDYETADTIETHRQILQSHKKVLWGWWKKRHEPLQENLLREIKKKFPLRIGLVNRLAGKLYFATCSGLIFDERGHLIPCPELSLAPSYYQTSAYPAWFEFTSIEETSRDNFISEFGGIPKGEFTLFPVEKKDKSVVLHDIQINPLDFIKTKGDSILHLSDLHFGDGYDFPLKAEDGMPTDSTLDSIIHHRVESLACKIGIVVISGDLITKGDANAYPGVTYFLEALLKKLDLGREHTIIVPGNHDIWWKEEVHPTYTYSKEEPYRLFLKSFYKSDIIDIENLHGFTTPSKWKISFLGLNSNRLESKKDAEYGFVGEDKYTHRLEYIIRHNGDRQFKELTRDRVLNFVVLHHHLIPPLMLCRPEKGRPVSITLDAGQIISNLQNANVNFVLHGHQHIPFLGNITRFSPEKRQKVFNGPPVYVIGGGSAGAKFDYLADEFRENSFGVYTPTEDGLKIVMEKFNKSVSPTPFINTIIPFQK